MTRLKVCGITRPEDAELAVELGAWALGFILWDASPRAADPTVVAGIVAAHRRTRFDVILCRFIDKKKGRVTIRTAGQFRRVLAKEAPDALL